MNIQNKQVIEPITVNSREAARLLGVSERTLYAMRQRGQIRAVPIDHTVKNPKLLYVYSDLKRFAEGGATMQTDNGPTS